ncbi:MAG: hypothetical protein IIB39_10790 [Candidatus Marinimicrobia bacterium]|nr:hypothetical protein [Candidatus Neomarinimicrobiota bacterium]
MLRNFMRHQRGLKLKASGIFFVFTIFLSLNATAFSQDQKGDVTFRRMGVHNGNLIATIFFNQGDISGWGGWGYPPPRVEWPKGSQHEYADENSLFVIAEVTDKFGNKIHILSESSLDWDATDINLENGEQMGWEPIPGYFNTGQESPAMSDLIESWPSFWPDKLDQDDSGWPDSWNGFFGRDIFQADQESYFVMDDNFNTEFPQFVPDPSDLSIKGLGLKVAIRGLQWADPLAQDAMFWLYDITNVSTTTYDKIIFGEVFDARMGGQGEENDDLAEFISEGNIDITFSWDLDDIGSGGWSPVGYFGFAFLESPGVATDGIDNDEDGLVDESRDSGPGSLIFGPIGIYGEPKEHWSGDEDGDWISFSDFNGNGILDPGEPLNDDLGKDGIGPDNPFYPGEDTGEGDGIPTDGEPNFDKTDVDESDQIGLTSMDAHIENSVRFSNDESMWPLLFPGHFNPPNLTAVNFEFFYGAGFFLLEPGKTERFSLAMVLGEDKDDILRNKNTVQNIYDANYRFKQPPTKPLVRVSAGDKRITLYWDSIAERSRDPIYGLDFEGYMIYKSTWFDFSDANPVTDSFGNAVFFEPVAQFDLVDGLVGPHPIGIGSEPGIDQPTGANLNMGTDTGLKHFWVDTDVVNGQKYFYAVVSYDKGYDTDFFERGLSSDLSLAIASPSISAIDFKLDRTGNVIGAGINTAVVTPNAPVTGYVPAAISELDHISGPGTGRVEYMILDQLNIKDNAIYNIVFDDISALEISYSIFNTTDNFQLVANQTGIDNDNSPEFEGIMLTVINDPEILWDEANSGWKSGSSNLLLDVADKKTNGVVLLRSPADYIIAFDSEFVDMSTNGKPAKFKIWDITFPDDPNRVKFWFKDKNSDGNLTGDFNNDFIYLEVDDPDGGGGLVQSWRIAFNEPPDILDTSLTLDGFIIIDAVEVEPIIPGAGDTLAISIIKPFRSGDVFEFKTIGASVNEAVAKTGLDEIFVVPNPYVASASWESRLPPGIISGRGERKIQFTHLPSKCTIRIYSVRGYLVDTLEHDQPLNDGTEFWDLKSKDGMDIAYGLYFYHVEAPGLGEMMGKFAVIK